MRFATWPITPTCRSPVGDVLPGRRCRRVEALRGQADRGRRAANAAARDGGDERLGSGPGCLGGASGARSFRVHRGGRGREQAGVVDGALESLEGALHRMSCVVVVVKVGGEVEDRQGENQDANQLDITDAVRSEDGRWRAETLQGQRLNFVYKGAPVRHLLGSEIWSSTGIFSQVKPRGPCAGGTSEVGARRDAPPPFASRRQAEERDHHAETRMQCSTASE